MSAEKRLPLGKKFVSQGRTISEGDFTMLTNLTWTTSELHSNKESMKNSRFGERILAGPIVYACVLGLSVSSGLRQAMKELGLKRIALMGFDEVRFTGPVKPGDTITAQFEFVSIRPSDKKPNRAVLKMKDMAFNQDGKEVMHAIRNILVDTTA